MYYVLSSAGPVSDLFFEVCLLATRGSLNGSGKHLPFVNRRRGAASLASTSCPSVKRAGKLKGLMFTESPTRTVAGDGSVLGGDGFVCKTDVESRIL